jgi:hypothetical protein
VHSNYTAATLQSQIIAPTVATINAVSMYSGNYKPDFLAFDKYGVDDIPGATGVGYLYNARDWNNVLAYAKGVSDSLASIPVMLWQIPGGHLQQVNDVDTTLNVGSTSPDYFFGDSYNPLSNLMAYIANTTLPQSIYGTTSLAAYLAMNEAGTGNGYTWQTSHMQLAANSHVFAILWGAGGSTSVGSFPSDDNGWLANKITTYYRNPTHVLRVNTSR